MRAYRSITLLELLIAIILLSIIVLGLGNIDLFSRFHVISSGRRAQIDNEASLALTHMSKAIAEATGNEISNGAETVVDLSDISNDPAIKVYVDLAADGISPGDGQRGTQGDRWIAYRFTDAHGSPGDRYQLWYCPNCQNPPQCTNCDPKWGTAANIVARNISLFSVCKPVGGSCTTTGSLDKNNVVILIRTCWDPAETYYSCGTPNNPSVPIGTTIKMPGVSTN